MGTATNYSWLSGTGEEVMKLVAVPNTAPLIGHISETAGWTTSPLNASWSQIPNTSVEWRPPSVCDRQNIQLQNLDQSR